MISGRGVARRLVVLGVVCGLLFSSTSQASEPGAGLIIFAGPTGPEVVAPDGTGRRQLPFGQPYSTASWSPDGTRIALATMAIEILRPDGSVLSSIELPDGFVNPGLPTWAPSGKQVAFTAFEKSLTKSGIFTANVDGTDVRRLTTGKYDWEPDWAPDGAWIAFTKDFRLHLIRPDGTGLHEMFGGGEPASDAAWSPDGRSIAYVRSVTQPTSLHSSLWVSDANGQNERRLSTGPTDLSPTWSPDGRFIAVSTRDAIDIVTRDGSGRGRVIFEPRQIREVSWRPVHMGLAVTAGEEPEVIARNAAATMPVIVESLGAAPASATVVRFSVSGPGRLLPPVGTTSGCSGGGAALSCELGTLAPDSQRVIKVRVTGNGPGKIVVTASVASTDKELDLTDNAMTASTMGSRCTVIGTPGADLLRGKPKQKDVICAGAGNDVIYARDGVPDVIEGGRGFDRVHADAFDRLVGVERRLAP